MPLLPKRYQRSQILKMSRGFPAASRSFTGQNNAILLCGAPAENPFRNKQEINEAGPISSSEAIELRLIYLHAFPGLQPSAPIPFILSYSPRLHHRHRH